MPLSRHELRQPRPIVTDHERFVMHVGCMQCGGSRRIGDRPCTAYGHSKPPKPSSDGVAAPTILPRSARHGQRKK